MNYASVLEENNVSVLDLIRVNPSMFFSLPLASTLNVVSYSDQLKYCADENIYDDKYVFMSNLLKHEKIEEIDPTMFVTFILNYRSSMNDLTEIINFIDKHPKSKEIILMLLKKHETHQNFVSNIVDSMVTKFNLILKYFDEDVFNVIAANNYPCFDDSNIEYLSATPENIEMFERLAYPLIKNNVSTHIRDLENTWHVHTIPKMLIEKLTNEQMITLFDYYDKEVKAQKEYFNYLIDRLSSYSSVITEETVMLIVEKHDLKVPRKFSESENVKRIKGESSKIVPNFDNPFSHINDKTLYEILQTVHAVKLKENAKSLDILLLNPSNLARLNAFGYGAAQLDKELILELFINHFDYVMDAFVISNSQTFMVDLFKEYLIHTDDKKDAFNKFMILHPHRNTMVHTFSDERVRCPEYLDMLLKHKKVLAYEVIGNLIKNKQENFLEFLNSGV